MYKTDLNLKIRTAFVCEKCRNDILKFIDEEKFNDFNKMFNLARDFALGNIKSIEEVPDNLNFPVAVILRKLKNENEIRNKLNILLDLFDIMVKLASIILVSRLKELNIEEKLSFENKNPSLGDWVDSLNKANKLLKQANDDYFDDNFPKIKKVISDISMNRIVALRNDLKHGHNLPEVEAKEKFGIYFPIIINILRELSAIFRIEMIMINKTEYDRKGKRYIVNVDDLMGDNLLFNSRDIIISQNLSIDKINELFTNKNILLYIKSKNTILKLYPYIVFRKCIDCGHSQVMVIDYEDKYLDIAVGHRVKIDI